MLKRIAICFVLLFSSALYAAVPTGAGPLQIRIPCLNTRWILSFTALYEDFYTSEVDYATRYPLLFAAGRNLDDTSDYDWGFSGTLGYIFPCTANDVQLSYTYFDSEEKDHARPHGEILIPNLTELDAGTIDIASQFGPGRVFLPVAGSPIVISPTGVITVPVNLFLTRATSKFKTSVTDLNFGQYVDVDEMLRVRLFAGLRYAFIKHNFDAEYHSSTTQSGLILIVNPAPTPPEEPVVDVTSTIDQLLTQRSTLTGLGPRFGFTSNLFLINGFGLFGSLSGAVLISDSKSKLFFVNHSITTATLEFIPPIVVPANEIFTVTSAQFPARTRVVPNFTGEIGIDYSFIWQATIQSTVTLSAGYQVDHYFNAVDRLSALNIDSPEFRTRHPLDVDFAGFFFRIEARI